MTGTFWFLKILTTAMGESTSDFFVHRFPPVLAVLGGAIVFTLALVWQLRAPCFRIPVYWSAVLMVSVFGTMCADVVHVGLHVPYVVSSITFAVALVVVFFSWYWFEATLSIHSIKSMRRELFYWASVTVTFALGTAVGDLTAYTLKFGYLRSSVVFSALFTLIALAFWTLRRSPILSFWVAYVLTRPLGASYADWFGVSHQRGGLNWGPGTVGLSLTAIIFLIVGALMVKDRATEKSSLSLR